MANILLEDVVDDETVATDEQYDIAVAAPMEGGEDLSDGEPADDVEGEEAE